MKCEFCTSKIDHEGLCDWCLENDFIVKDYCVQCGNPIDGTYESFLERGNYCPHCNAEDANNAKYGVKLKDIFK